MKNLIIISIFLCLFIISCKEDKIVELALFTISGVVENENGEKISADLFLIAQDTLKIRSNSEGTFIFENLSEGEYSLTIIAENFLNFDSTFTVSKNLDLQIVLSKIPNTSKPELPTNFRIESISETEMKILWDDNCDFEDGYKIVRYSGNDALEINLPSNTTSWIDENMTPDVAPQYKIFAFTKFEQSDDVEIITRWQYFNFSQTNNIGFASKCEFNYNDELIIAYNFSNGNLQIVGSDNLTQIAQVNSENFITAFAVSNLNNRLFYGDDNGKIFVYDIDATVNVDELFYHEFKIEQLAVSSDNNFLLSCDTSRIVLYNLQAKSIVKEWDLDNFKVRDLEFSNNMKYFVFGKQDRFDHIIELWDFSILSIIDSYSFNQYGGTELEFNNDDNFIAVSSGTVMDGSSFLLKTLDLERTNIGYGASRYTRFNNKSELMISQYTSDKNPGISFYNLSDLLSGDQIYFEDRVFTENSWWVDISKDGNSFISCGNEGFSKWNLFSEKKWSIYSLNY